METEKKNKIKKKYLIAASFLLLAVVILIIVIWWSSKLNNNEKDNGVNLEEKMESMVSAFYDKNIKGLVVGVHRQIVTLEDLQNQEYDISDFTKAECSLESFSYVLLENPDETDKEKIKYTIENHLDCK